MCQSRVGNGFFLMREKKGEKNVDNQLALKQKKGGQPANSLAYIYIYRVTYIYILPGA